MTQSLRKGRLGWGSIPESNFITGRCQVSCPAKHWMKKYEAKWQFSRSMTTYFVTKYGFKLEETTDWYTGLPSPRMLPYTSSSLQIIAFAVLSALWFYAQWSNKGLKTTFLAFWNVSPLQQFNREDWELLLFFFGKHSLIFVYSITQRK